MGKALYWRQIDIFFFICRTYSGELFVFIYITVFPLDVCVLEILGSSKQNNWIKFSNKSFTLA